MSLSKLLWSSVVALAFIGCKTVEVKTEVPLPTLPTQELLVTQSLTEFKVRYSATVQSQEPITIQKAIFEMVVDGKVTHHGEKTLGVQVMAGQTAPIVMEETTPYVTSADELKGMDSKGGSLLAALRGRLVFTGQSGKSQEVEFARSREVRVPRLPHMKFQELEAGRYSEDEAGVTFHVGVYNPNPFEVQVTAITYKVEIAGKTVSESVIGRGERVSPASTGVFDIEAKVSAETHGAKEIKALIKSKVMPYVITGTLKSDLFEEAFEFKGEIKLNTSK